VTPQPLGSTWHISSFSNEGGENCVEAANLGSIVAVRDSKRRDGASLRLTPASWHAFTKTLR
jgi:hypothetical protein